MDHESSWISMRAYARHRSVTHRAVAKAIEAGRITAVKRDERGRVVGIDAARADLEWLRNTDPLEAAKNGKVTAVPLGAMPAGAAPAGISPSEAGEARVGPDGGALQDMATAAGESSAPGGSPPAEPNEYLVARAKREGYLAETAKLDHLERLGLLVSSAEVEQEIAEIFGEVKSNVFRIADRRAQVLAVEADPVRVHRLLSDEFRMVFDELSRRFAAYATGGAEQSTSIVS